MGVLTMQHFGMGEGGRCRCVLWMGFCLSLYKWPFIDVVLWTQPSATNTTIWLNTRIYYCYFKRRADCSLELETTPPEMEERCFVWVKNENRFPTLFIRSVVLCVCENQFLPQIPMCNWPSLGWMQPSWHPLPNHVPSFLTFWNWLQW